MICIRTCVSSRYCDRDCELSHAEYIAGIWPCSCFFSLIFSFCFSESFRLLKLIGDSTATKSESSFFETNVEEIGFEPRRPDLNSKIKNFIFFSSPILDWRKSLRLLKKDMSFLDYSVRACFNIKSKKNVWMSIYEKNLVSTSFTPVELWSDCTPYFFCTTTQWAAKIPKNQAEQKWLVARHWPYSHPIRLWSSPR